MEYNRDENFDYAIDFEYVLSMQNGTDEYRQRFLLPHNKTPHDLASSLFIYPIRGRTVGINDPSNEKALCHAACDEFIYVFEKEFNFKINCWRSKAKNIKDLRFTFETIFGERTAKLTQARFKVGSYTLFYCQSCYQNNSCFHYVALGQFVRNRDGVVMKVLEVYYHCCPHCTCDAADNLLRYRLDGLCQLRVNISSLFGNTFKGILDKIDTYDSPVPCASDKDVENEWSEHVQKVLGKNSDM